MHDSPRLPLGSTVQHVLKGQHAFVAPRLPRETTARHSNETANPNATALVSTRSRSRTAYATTRSEHGKNVEKNKEPASVTCQRAFSPAKRGISASAASTHHTTPQQTRTCPKPPGLLSTRLRKQDHFATHLAKKKGGRKKKLLPFQSRAEGTSWLGRKAPLQQCFFLERAVAQVYACLCTCLY